MRRILEASFYAACYGSAACFALSLPIAFISAAMGGKDWAWWVWVNQHVTPEMVFGWTSPVGLLCGIGLLVWQLLIAPRWNSFEDAFGFLYMFFPILVFLFLPPLLATSALPFFLALLCWNPIAVIIFPLVYLLVGIEGYGNGGHA